MRLTLNYIYKSLPEILQPDCIDLTKIEFVEPWGIAVVCALIIDRVSRGLPNIKLPRNPDIKTYLKRIHFDKLLSELSCRVVENSISEMDIDEVETLNLQELELCASRDVFNARLEKFHKMFLNCGLSADESSRATSLVGELGNNVFDHNGGSWPTDVSGCIITAQHWPKSKRIDVVVADAGVGFIGSLKSAFPDLRTDLEAIRLGLSGGITGRVGEKRGKGLKLVQDWTLNNFSGVVIIHSGTGLVSVSSSGIEESNVQRILGTLAGFMIFYK